MEGANYSCDALLMRGKLMEPADHLSGAVPLRWLADNTESNSPLNFGDALRILSGEAARRPC